MNNTKPEADLEAEGWGNDFVDESIGYRPGRSPRQATQELGEALHDGKHRWVVEADIRVQS